MIIMRKSILFASMAALMMSSCSSNEFDFGGSDAGSKLQVSASIHELQTRAHDTSWDANDAIGVSDNDKNVNVKYVTTSGDGTFSSDETIYLLGDEKHSFTAYYPYNESVTAESKTITFEEPADYMYGTAEATRSNPNAAFTFTHKMSELSFTVTDASSTNSSSARTWTRADGDDAGSTTTPSTITLHDVVIGGTFDTSNGTVTAGSTKGDLTINFTPGSKASFILPQQTFLNGFEISVNYNGKTYGGTISLDKTTEGNDIQYGLTINKDNQQQALTVSSKTITGWTAVDKGNQNLEEKEAENVLEIGDFLLNDGSVVDKAYDLSKVTAAGKSVVGVVYYVGNPQPSVLYSGTIEEGQDILKTDAPNATNGLAIALKNANETESAITTADFNYSELLTSGKDNYQESLANTYTGKTLNWSTNNLANTSFMLGYNNTKIIENNPVKVSEANPAQTGIDIITAFRSNNKVTNASDWYIPSYTEMKAIIDNYVTIKASIEKANGSLEQFDFGDDKRPTSFYWTSDMRGGQYSWVTTLTSKDTEVDESTSKATNTIYLNRKSTKGFYRLAIAF